MRVLPLLLLTAFLGSGLTGCSLFKKSTNDQAPQSQVPPPRFPTSPADPAPAKGASAASGTSVLAGRVLDGMSRPPGNTSILVVRVDGKEEREQGDVPVSAEGHFTISNLAQGGQYKLVARGKNGDRTVAGVHYATAPNPRVLIQMRDDFTAATTPPIPAPFDSLKEDRASVNQGTTAAPAATPPTQGASLQTPAPSGAAKASWQPSSSASGPGEFTLPAVHVPMQPDVPIAQNRGAWVPPPLEIGRPRPLEQARIAPNTPPPPPPPTPAQDPVPNLGPARVPSCVKVGKTVVNFALNDVNGEPWEFRTSKRGKLVLLDFWFSTCGPCLRTIPSLVGLQSRYSPQDLEIVGIAYERSGTPQEQAYKVNAVCKQLLVNYRQLLGSGDRCVVRDQFGVNGFPTLVLLDENGTEIWRHEGMLSSADLAALDRGIQSRISLARR